MKTGYLVLENGPAYVGIWQGGKPQAGEVVFNTSNSGYEEMATDPSYFSQIIITTATQQGNYGIDQSVWESKKIWIRGFICQEIQKSARDSSWLDLLDKNSVPVLTELDTRSIVMHLRSAGTTWGAIVQAPNEKVAREEATAIIKKAKDIQSDWTQLVCRQKAEDLKGDKAGGPKVALLDFGTKENIVRELLKRCREVRVFPSNSSADEIKAYKPDGILLSNGPGDPADVKTGTQTVRDLLGYKYIFGICMGHQILCQALGGKTYKLKFGHRGSNHPIRDHILKQVYVTSQNHGYNVDLQSLPAAVHVTHINLNDQTVAGIAYEEMQCFSVQFHPESHPGPHDAQGLFDYFIKRIT